MGSDGTEFRASCVSLCLHLHCRVLVVGGAKAKRKEDPGLAHAQDAISTVLLYFTL